MTNREKLTKTNIYDLLRTIQKAHMVQQALSEDGGEISGLCVIENIEKKPRPCPKGGICGMCIANWLNQEAETAVAGCDDEKLSQEGVIE